MSAIPFKNNIPRGLAPGLLINRVLPLFDTNGKSFVQVQTDSSNGYLLIKKEKDHGKHRFLYKDMLPEDLYEYKLKSDEDEYLRNIFKAHILIRDKFYHYCPR